MMDAGQQAKEGIGEPEWRVGDQLMFLTCVAFVLAIQPLLESTLHSGPLSNEGVYC